MKRASNIKRFQQPKLSPRQQNQRGIVNQSPQFNFLDDQQMLKIQQLKKINSPKSNGSKNEDIEAVRGNPTAQRHLLHSKLPYVSSTDTPIEVSGGRGSIPTLEDAQLPQFAIQPEQVREKYLMTSNTAAPMESLSPTFGNQSASSNPNHLSKQALKTNDFFQVEGVKTGVQQNQQFSIDDNQNFNVSGGKQFIDQPTGSNFADNSSQFNGSPILNGKSPTRNRRESLNSLLTPVVMVPMMPHVTATIKETPFKEESFGQEENFGCLQVGSIRNDKQSPRTTIKDLTTHDSRNLVSPRINHISFEKTHSTNLAPIEQTVLSTKGSGSFHRNDQKYDNALEKLQNPNISEITKHGPGQIMVQYRQLQLQNFAKQAVFNPGLVVGQKIEQVARRDTGKLKHGLTGMTGNRSKASRSPKNEDLPHLVPIKLNLSRSNSKDGSEQFEIQQSLEQGSSQWQLHENQSPQKRQDQLKKHVYLQQVPSRTDDLISSNVVIGTRVILSNPKSRDEDVHTDIGSSLIERKGSPASNIKRLQRQSLAIVESEENRMLAKDSHTPSSPFYAGFTPQTPLRFEGKFDPNTLANSNFVAHEGHASLSDNNGVGTEQIGMEGKRNSQFLIESSQDESPQPQNMKLSTINQQQEIGTKSNEFAQLNEGDKALLEISEGQYQISGILDPPPEILSQLQTHELGQDSMALFQNTTHANNTFINRVQNELDVESTVKIVSSKKNLNLTNEFSEGAVQSMQAYRPVGFSSNVSNLNSGVTPNTPYNPFSDEKIRVLSGEGPDNTDRRQQKRHQSPRRTQIHLKATSINSSQAIGITVAQSKTEAVSIEQRTEWKQLKTTGSENIDFKPESGLSHQANTAPRISVLEAKLSRDAQNTRISVEVSASSNASKSGTGSLDKNKSGRMPLKKILGIEQKTGNVKIAQSSRMSKSPTRHPFHAHSLIELGRRSLDGSQESLQTLSPGDSLSPEYGKDFFVNKDLEKFKGFEKRKDFSGFIHKDTAWMQEKGEDGKVVCPAYSHVYERKLPAKPIHGRIFRKVAQQLDKVRQRSRPKYHHVNTQIFTSHRLNQVASTSEPPQFLSSKEKFLQKSSHLNNSYSSGSNFSQTEQQMPSMPTRGSRMSSTKQLMANDSTLQHNMGIASGEISSLLQQKQMLEQYMVSNNSTPHRLINFENSGAKSLYGNVAESKMEESRNHFLFDKSKLSPAPTGGVAAEKKLVEQPLASSNKSGPTSAFESSKTNFQEGQGPSQQGVVEQKESKKKKVKPTKQRSIRKIQISTQNYTKIDDIIAQTPYEHSSHMMTQNSMMTSQTPFGLKSTQPIQNYAQVAEGEKELASRNYSNGIRGESSTFIPSTNQQVKETNQTQYTNQPMLQSRDFVKEVGQDVDPSLLIKQIGTTGSRKSPNFQVDIQVPSQNSSQQVLKIVGDGPPTNQSNAKDHQKIGMVNSISYNADALKNMANQFQFKKNKRVFVVEKPLGSKQEIQGEKTLFLSQGMRDQNRKSFVEQNQVLLGGHKDLQKRPTNLNAHFANSKAGDKNNLINSSKQDLGQQFQFQQQSSFNIRGAKLSFSGHNSRREGQRVAEFANEQQNSSPTPMNIYPLNLSKQQRLIQQSQLLKQVRSPQGGISPFDALTDRGSKQDLEVKSTSVHSSVLQQISEIGHQYVAVRQTPYQANASNVSSSPAMKQINQHALQTATQPRRTRKKKSKHNSTAQPLLNMSQVLNEINHSIKSPAPKRSPEHPQNEAQKPQDQKFRNAKKLSGHNPQKSSAFIPNGQDISLFALDTPNILPKNLKSQLFSPQPVTDVSKNLELPDVLKKRKGHGQNFQNMLSPLPERSHEAMSSKTIRGLDSEATAYYSGLKNTMAIQEHQDLDQRIKKLQNKTFQKKAIASIESIKNFQLITMSNFDASKFNQRGSGNQYQRQERTPDRVLRSMKKKAKVEDETIRVLKEQLSQNNSQDLLEQTNQISQEILKQVLTNSNQSKISITFDDRGVKIQKTPTDPINQKGSNQNNDSATFAAQASDLNSENPVNDAQNAEALFNNHWSFTKPKQFNVPVHDKEGLQNCKPIVSVIPGNTDPNFQKDITRHKEFQNQNLSPGKNLAKIKQNIVDSSLQAPHNAKRSTLLNLDKDSREPSNEGFSPGPGTNTLKKSMFPEIKVNQVHLPKDSQRQSQVYSN